MAFVMTSHGALRIIFFSLCILTCAYPICLNSCTGTRLFKHCSFHIFSNVIKPSLPLYSFTLVSTDSFLFPFLLYFHFADIPPRRSCMLSYPHTWSQSPLSHLSTSWQQNWFSVFFRAHLHHPLHHPSHEVALYPIELFDWYLPPDISALCMTFKIPIALTYLSLIFHLIFSQRPYSSFRSHDKLVQTDLNSGISVSRTHWSS